jgi:hypothetical protein
MTSLAGMLRITCAQKNLLKPSNYKNCLARVLQTRAKMKAFTLQIAGRSALLVSSKALAREAEGQNLS